MGKPCIAFEMEDASKALGHMDLEIVRNYGRGTPGHPLFTWDDGERILYRCKACGGYVLGQFSEYHGMEDDDYYTDYFPVDGQEEAEALNKKYDGFEIEKSFPKRWMIKGSPERAHWAK